ncbi:DUF2244 domain-containing protein [Oceaniglobus indicus]|uniref:DUF2244 domain-containing protein n=1 Tax=Oceaniglobus indicus TaxID=2047749 RepID=UPI000C179099|nr:DUF2244 domain-containing protein [Oceaniglobus indicus]
MPLTWTEDPRGAIVPAGTFAHAAGDDALTSATLWPHRSLPRKGMVIVIGFAFVMILLPVIAMLGTPVLWGLLPFTMAAIGFLWLALEKSYASGALREDLTLWSDRIELIRTNPDGPQQCWAANPFWVRVAMHETGGPVENYVTLSGAGREVEVGAFLSPEERRKLCDDLERLLNRLSRNA